MVVMCKECSKVYSSQSNLNRHLKEIHGLNAQIIFYDKNVTSFKCLEGCNISFRLRLELVRHLEDCHNFKMEREMYEFSTIEDFQIWLRNVQSVSNAEYIFPRGLVFSVSVKDVYYDCSRSGKSREVSHIRKRTKKCQGSKKINVACTSQIKLIKNETNSRVKAIFDKTHYGHSVDIQHLSIPKVERANIAQKLNSGVSVTRILDNNRNNFNDEKLKRIDLLTKKDIGTQYLKRI
ncbi:zinc finger transcription factor family protein 17-like [Diabrotica undecimpunctata]|uniref:zinc finger transcription factor family protein 17-like n=1 Tax=Diabrotica undecimpunctata TaxID=50387 RepID=UPI003B63FD12